MEQMVLQEQVELLELVVLMGHQELMVLQEHQELMVLQGLQVLMVRMVHQELVE